MYRNEINKVNQLQLNYSTNIHLLIPWFMKSSCVITITLKTLTDVPYKMTVVGAFVYVCERDRGPRRPRYNGVAVYRGVAIPWFIGQTYDLKHHHCTSKLIFFKHTTHCHIIVHQTSHIRPCHTSNIIFLLLLLLSKNSVALYD